MTCAPAFTSSLAVSTPIPVLAPVMIITEPVKSRF